MIKNLIIIDGAAGPGKKDLIQFINDKKYKNTAYVQKYTTKPSEKISKPSDLIHINSKNFEKMKKDDDFKTYKYGNNKTGELHDYGFKISEIENALKSSNNIFVIIRNRELIDEITSEFQNNYRVTKLFIYSEKEALLEHYTKYYPEDTKETGKEDRIEKTSNIVDDLKEHYKKTYNEPVIYFSDKEKFFIHLTAILDELNKEFADFIDVSPQEIYLLPRSLKEYKTDIISKMNYKGRGFSKNIFLMMDFHKEADSEYTEIKKLLETEGYNCVCLKDDTTEDGKKDEAHWNIKKGSTENFLAVTFCCKYGIALFDKPINGQQYFNPNVMYELGLMHQQRKRCLIIIHNELHDIITSDKKRGVPYDFAKDNYETYEKETQIMLRIRKFLDEIKNDSDSVYLPLFIK